MSCKPSYFCRIAIMLFFLNGSAFAQNDTHVLTDTSGAPAVEDSASNNYENVADTLLIKSVFESTGDSILKLKRGREFGYMHYLDSLLRKKTDLRIDTVSIDKGTVHKNTGTMDAASDSNPGSVLNSFPVKFFFWAVAIFFIGFILFKLFLAGGLFVKGNVKAGNEPVNKEPEILNAYYEYNALIHEAELKNDFNLSVRYLYLQTLKKLADSGLIIFSPDKANNLYVRELAGDSFREEFAFLTFNYEYAWYGKFTIDLPRYQRLKEEFILFNKKA